MLSLMPKFPSVIPCVRSFVFRLYASAAKSSKFPSVADPMKTKMNIEMKAKKVETKNNEPKSKPAKKDALKVAKKPPLKKSPKRQLGKKPVGGGGGDKGGGSTPSKDGSKKPPSKTKQPMGYRPLDKCDIFEVPKTNSGFYGCIAWVMVPVIAGFAGYLFTNTEETEGQFVPYEYMYKRLKRFPWRDGRTSLFHGPNNFIPDEERYEKRPNRWEIDLERRKQLRDQHAKEELERRKLRQDREGPRKPAPKDTKEGNITDDNREKNEEETKKEEENGNEVEGTPTEGKMEKQ